MYGVLRRAQNDKARGTQNSGPLFFKGEFVPACRQTGLALRVGWAVLGGDGRHPVSTVVDVVRVRIFRLSEVAFADVAGGAEGLEVIGVGFAAFGPWVDVIYVEGESGLVGGGCSAGCAAEVVAFHDEEF